MAIILLMVMMYSVKNVSIFNNIVSHSYAIRNGKVKQDFT